MKKAFYLLLALCLYTGKLLAQAVSINTDGSAPAPSAILDVKSTNKGMLVPRMTTAQRTAIAAPATGLLVYDTNTNGFWFYNGSAWTNIGGGGGTSSLITDADADTKVQVEKNPDEDIVRFDLAGTENMVLRKNAGGSPRLELPNTLDNTFIGTDVGNATTTGGQNTVLGNFALSSNSTGFENTAIGFRSMFDNTSGAHNTAVGEYTLDANTTGTGNTTIGAGSLNFTTTGSGNSAIGEAALVTNVTGNNNTALGRFADVSSANLSNATAIGFNAKVGASNSLVLGGTGADAVNVGIGTATPGRPVQVQAETYGISHIFGGTELTTYVDSTAAWIGTTTDHPLLFFTFDAPTPQMMITQDGKVGIGTSAPAPSALLEMQSTDRGVLVPRMTSAQRTAIATPATGLLVYDTNTNGFWFYNGTAWTAIGGGVSTLIADADNNTKIQVEKNANEDIVRFDLAGSENMVLRRNTGGWPMLEFPNGSANTLIGVNAGRITTGGQNTGIGAGVFFNNTTGFSNTAIGTSAMNNNIGGSQNTAVGPFALFGNTTATENTAVGAGSVTGTTTGNGNTGVGVGALVTNTTGANNTALGKGADVTVNNLSNATAVGSIAAVNASNKVRIGNAAVTVIEGQVDWTFPSDARFKFNVHDDQVPGLALIEKLRPVTYQFDTRKFDEHLMQNLPDSLRQRRMAAQDYRESSARMQTGFLAQEVEKACQDLNFDFSGLHVPSSASDNYGISYGSFVPLLVKAVQEQQAEIKMQQAEIKTQQTRIDAQQAEIEQLKRRDAEHAALKVQLEKITAALQQAGISLE